MSQTQGTSSSSTPALRATPTPPSGPAAVDSGNGGHPNQQQHSSSSGSGTSDPDALRNLIVNYLPPMMNESQVYELFGQFGPIENVKIIYDKMTGESRGYGFVKFQFFFSATYAVSCLNRFEIAGKKLKVAYANAPAAKEAYELLRLSSMALTMQQQQAMQSMYHNQMALSQEEEAGRRWTTSVSGLPPPAVYHTASSAGGSRQVTPSIAPVGM